MPGQDHLPFVGDQDAILDEMEEFLTGVRHRAEPDTVLATVLVAEIAGARDHVERHGQDRWRGLLRRLHAYIAKEIEWFRGREIDIAGNRLLAIFDGPARAVRCASTITQYASRLGVTIRAGLHTGECETHTPSGNADHFPVDDYGREEYYSRKGAKAQSAAAFRKGFFPPLRLCVRKLPRPAVFKGI